ncbi:hypothetical protein PilKf_01849 [Pillotina sp. SPG140]|jgi:lipid II:glycine glycyltransferase (peptidoglycan interpeptide bridge formation enzyme)
MEYLHSVKSTHIASCDSAESFLQSGFWGSFKAKFGWSVRCFSLDYGDYGRHPLLVLKRYINFGFSFAYIPFGPEIPHIPSDNTVQTEVLCELAQKLFPLFPKNIVFIRFDPPWLNATETMQMKKPLHKAGADVQPAHTVILDLRPSTETILNTMKSKWRYNIGLARKKGVTVARTDRAGVERFYALLRETAQRDSLNIHGIHYYQELFNHAHTYDGAGTVDLRLYEAIHEGETIAAIVVLFYNGTATYLYGASSNRKRNLMATYLLQWHALCEAKTVGCSVYDFFGIPPHADPTHPMAGLYQFKTGFGGTVAHRAGSWDYAYHPCMHRLFIYAEAVRKLLWTTRRTLLRMLKKI